MPYRPPRTFTEGDHLVAIKQSLLAHYGRPPTPGEVHPLAVVDKPFSPIDAAKRMLEIAYGPDSVPIDSDGYAVVVKALGTTHLPSLLREVGTAITVARRSAILEDVLSITHPLSARNYQESGFVTVDVGDVPLPSAQTMSNFWAITPRPSAERVQLWSLPAQLIVSRQALANDDAAYFPAAIAAFANAVHRAEMRAIASKLEANAALEDGTALFHADRGNVATAALDAGGLGTVYSTLALQPAEAGIASCARPHALVVHPDDAVAALSLVEALPEQGRPLVVSNAFLADNSAWYAVADPAQFPTLGRVLMEGADASGILIGMPRSASFEDRDGVLHEFPGISYEVSHTVGHAVLSAVGIARFTKA